eukprot:scaffold71560_cov24-Cyclotella_meneghiniana.AAC.1
MTAATLKPSEEALEEQRAWDDLSSWMDEQLSSFESKADQLKQQIQRGDDLIDAISNEKELLRARAEEICSSINSQIEVESDAFRSESNELANIMSTVQALERALEHETKQTSEVVSRQRQVEQSIRSFQSEAASEVGEISELEYSHKKQLTKIARTISMYAEMTKIKWDYTKADVLAGEISLPKRFEHVRFCVEKDLGDVEIAEKIWGYIEG